MLLYSRISELRITSKLYTKHVFNLYRNKNLLLNNFAFRIIPLKENLIFKNELSVLNQARVWHTKKRELGQLQNYYEISPHFTSLNWMKATKQRKGKIPFHSIWKVKFCSRLVSFLRWKWEQIKWCWWLHPSSYKFDEKTKIFPKRFTWYKWDKQ